MTELGIQTRTSCSKILYSTTIPPRPPFNITTLPNVETVSTPAKRKFRNKILMDANEFLVSFNVIQVGFFKMNPVARSAASVDKGGTLVKHFRDFRKQEIGCKQGL